jgi:hypothetical protein
MVALNNASKRIIANAEKEMRCIILDVRNIRGKEAGMVSQFWMSKLR